MLHIEVTKQFESRYLYISSDIPQADKIELFHKAETRKEKRKWTRCYFYFILDVIKSRAGHIARKRNNDVPFPYKPESVVFQV